MKIKMKLFVFMVVSISIQPIVALPFMLILLLDVLFALRTFLNHFRAFFVRIFLDHLCEHFSNIDSLHDRHSRQLISFSGQVFDCMVELKLK